MDVDDRVGGYARDVVGNCSPACIASVARFEAGDRHAVYRVSYRDAVGGTKDLVVRVSTRDDPAERAQAELEAAVLETLHGIGAPRLDDFRRESAWFETPVMCMEFGEGEQRDVLLAAPPEDVERLGAVVASVHNLPVDDLVDWFPGASTITTYADELRTGAPRGELPSRRWSRSPARRCRTPDARRGPSLWSAVSQPSAGVTRC
ncbi:MAG: hypothetical protein M3P83_03975 [Actinomycetota bacterium]|nr:hypothetical protein [Actinomycetota bacterium]